MQEDKKKVKIREFLYEGKSVSSQEAYDEGIFTEILKFLGVAEAAIDMVIKINGDSIDTYNDILYAATGYNDLNQINSDWLY